jgi:ubiquinone/menaquinone biosynthesis C-methylase UbiE
MASTIQNTSTTEPPTKKVKTGVLLHGSETVLFEGVDGEKNEFCPYTKTSQKYDETRAPLGLNIAIGSMALLDKPLCEQALLDIGCGTGTFLKIIKEKVGSVSGLEYNDGMIGKARELLGDNCKLVQGSADKLPFPDASFDVCTMNQVHHHFPNTDNYAFTLRSFQEIHRVLKPGGIFVLNASTPEQQRDAFWWLSLFPKASEAQCARFPSLDILKQHFKTAKLDLSADSVVVPLERSLMADDKYLTHGVKSAFMPWYRDGDSSWSMAENFGELEPGLKKLQGMIDAGTADYWLEGRELLRRSMGQATFITVRKPLA